MLTLINMRDQFETVAKLKLIGLVKKWKIERDL